MRDFDLRANMVLDWSRDLIDVTSSLPEPDPDWRYTDKSGHKHRWQDGYPTLIEVEDERYWCDECRDEHIDSHLECSLCHEHIKPGTRTPLNTYLPGPVTYTLNGERITKERYDELVSQLVRP